MYPKRGLDQLRTPLKTVRVYLGGSVVDGAAVWSDPGAGGAVAIGPEGILAAGERAQVLRQVGRGEQQIDLGDRLLIPGLVNAHTHLDLTGLGPRRRPSGQTFLDWVGMVMRERLVDPQAIEASVVLGQQLSRHYGVTWFGDIAGEDVAHRSMNVPGVSFREFFGLGGVTLEQSLNYLTGKPWSSAVPDVASGLEPHAPYSAGPELYRAAAALDRPLSTHLAETPQELQFVAQAAGPFKELLVRLGKWDDRYARDYNQGQHPVDWLAALASDSRWVCAHCNYVGDAQIQSLARLGWSVVYCPRASEYFGHAHHPYRQMLEAGVNVCLGTDSILCHQSLSILDEMRLLRQRDRTEPRLLLTMATTQGLKALGADPLHATFGVGSRSQIVAIRYDAGPAGDPLQNILADNRVLEIEVYS